MNAVSRRRRLPVWIALLAMLWQLLLPWSQAHSAGGELVPVCTATGLKWIALDGAPDESHADSQRSHCALCWFGQQVPALHDTRGVVLHAVAVMHVAHTPRALRPRGSEPGAPPPIRAPPSCS